MEISREHLITAVSDYYCLQLRNILLTESCADEEGTEGVQ